MNQQLHSNNGQANGSNSPNHRNKSVAAVAKAGFQHAQIVSGNVGSAASETGYLHALFPMPARDFAAAAFMLHGLRIVCLTCNTSADFIDSDGDFIMGQSEYKLSRDKPNRHGNCSDSDGFPPHKIMRIKPTMTHCHCGSHCVLAWADESKPSEWNNPPRVPLDSIFWNPDKQVCFYSPSEHFYIDDDGKLKSIKTNNSGQGERGNRNWRHGKQRATGNYNSTQPKYGQQHPTNKWVH
jgi:hypothetical protein